MAAQGVVKRISQETFDSVVEENMVDFEMPWEEAVADAVTQFEVVGVNLSNIIKDTKPEDRVTQEHPVIAAVKAVRASGAPDAEAAASATSASPAADAIMALGKIVAGDKEAKALAAAAGGMPALWGVASTAALDSPITTAAFTVMRTMCDGCNEAKASLPSAAVQQACDAILEGGLSDEVSLLLHTCLVVFCARCEDNKRLVQASGLFLGTLATTAGLVEGACVPATKGLPVSEAPSDLGDVSGSVLHAQVNLMRSVVSGDDMNATVSKAFDFARELGGCKTADVLLVAGAVANSALAAPAVAGEVPGALVDALHLIRCLAVNDDICVRYSDRGVLDLMVRSVTAFPKSPPLMKAACGAIRKLAHSDHVKRAVCVGDAAPLGVLLAGLQGFSVDVGVLEQALAALSVVSLRIPANALTIADRDAIPYVAQAMRMHPTVPGVQRQCCLCLRNLVSRNKEALTEAILEEGAAALLQAARAAHDICKDVASAALRDLEVE